VALVGLAPVARATGTEAVAADDMMCGLKE